MKIWLDDQRPILELHDKEDIELNKEEISKFILCKTYKECIDLLENDKDNEITEIHLDHDLGTWETGYDVILWLEKRIWDGIPIPKMHVHTANSVAYERMTRAIECIEKTVERLKKGKENK